MDEWVVIEPTVQESKDKPNKPKNKPDKPKNKPDKPKNKPDKPDKNTEIIIHTQPAQYVKPSWFTNIYQTIFRGRINIFEGNSYNDFLDLILGDKVYILKLEDKCWYVGWTNAAGKRIAQHFNGKGAEWPKLHKPLRVVAIIPDGTLEMENQITLQYMLKYGYEKVRGGGWCHKDITEPYALRSARPQSYF